MEIDHRPTVDAPDDDPHLWLEGIDDKRALRWVRGQNEITLAEFGDASYARDRKTLTKLLDHPDRIPYVSRRGNYLYNFWTDADHPRGVWRRTTETQFKTETPQWEVLIDIDALAADDQEDWVWHGAHTLANSHDIAIIRLSRGGSDAVCLREFDLSARAIARNGFHTDQAKCSCDWLNRDTLLICTTTGEDMATHSGYPRKVQKWHRGQNLADAEVLFEGNEDSISVSVYRDLSVAVERIWYFENTGFFDTVRWIGDSSGPKQRVNLPLDAETDAEGQWIAVRPREDWTVGSQTYAADTLVGTDLNALLEGRAEYTVLFKPEERRILSGFYWCNGRLILSILDNLSPVHEALIPDNGGWVRTTLDELPGSGVVNVWPLDQVDSESNGDLLAQTEDPITPPTLLLLQTDKAPELLKKSPARFNSENLHVSQHEAISSDGERIPYTQVGPEQNTDNAPVHLTGYGGFRVPLLPYYAPPIGKLWLERGGTAVIANIRGGDEFGTRWHEAGRRAGKRLSHDDFAAVAADLVERGVTIPERIAAEGGSNGGILISNMMTRYPDRFGALFCTIPLIDMRRYSKLLAGASWIDEYGDPDKPEDWEFLKTYSAYHMAEPDKPYPPVLLATSRSDDRVHPGHARKMAAKLHAMGYQAHFYEPETGGHGYGKNNEELAGFISLGFQFLRKSIGWEWPEDK